MKACHYIVLCCCCGRILGQTNPMSIVFMRAGQNTHVTALVNHRSTRGVYLILNVLRQKFSEHRVFELGSSLDDETSEISQCGRKWLSLLRIKPPPHISTFLSSTNFHTFSMSNSTTPGHSNLIPQLTAAPTTMLSLETLSLQPGQDPGPRPQLGPPFPLSSPPPGSPHLVPLRLNSFFTSVTFKSWYGINIYYYYRNKTLTSYQNLKLYITDLMKISRDRWYTTETERLYATAILGELTPAIFQEGKYARAQYVREVSVFVTLWCQSHNIAVVI